MAIHPVMLKPFFGHDRKPKKSPGTSNFNLLPILLLNDLSIWIDHLAIFDPALTLNHFQAAVPILSSGTDASTASYICIHTTLF